MFSHHSFHLFVACWLMHIFNVKTPLMYLPLFLFHTCLANGSDSKKQRLDESPPSRVLHIRKLPNEVSETEVIALGLPFGKVTNILMLKGKNQVNYKIISPSSNLLELRSKWGTLVISIGVSLCIFSFSFLFSFFFLVVLGSIRNPLMQLCSSRLF